MKVTTNSKKKEAEQIFKIGDVYTVDRVEVGSCSSTIVLNEFPDKRFNTVFFKRVTLV